MTRDELILSATKQVNIVAGSIYRKIGRTVPLADLRQIGTIGAINAADAFDSSRGVKFSSYADYRIRGAILDFLREDSGLRNTRQAYSDDDLMFDAIPNAKRREVVSLDAMRRENGKPIEILFATDPRDLERESIEADLLRRRQEWLGKKLQQMDLRTARIIRRLLLGNSEREIAKDEALSESRISQIKVGAVRRLRKAAAA